MPKSASNGAHGKSTAEIIKNNPWAIQGLLANGLRLFAEQARTRDPESGQRAPYVVSSKCRQEFRPSSGEVRG